MTRVAALIVTAMLLGCAVGEGDEIDRGAQAACSAPAYRAGAPYQAGDLVTASGKTYRCKPYPYSGWCSIGSAYAPGTGFAWADAWSEVSGCSGGGTTGAPPSAPPGTGGGCSATEWSAGKQYRTGDVVRFKGSHYVAEHDNPGYDPTISTWFWDPKTCTGGTTGGSAGGTTGGTTGASGLSSILGKSTFEAMFPSRNGFYTYEGLVEATKKFPAFATTGSADARKREVAAFLANVNHETGALVYVEEINKSDYTDWGAAGCAPEAGKRYFGRGPIQLSWNYNYCAASRAIFGDQEVLRRDPDRVARESWVAWATGIWYWMTSTGPGTMTCHDAMAFDRGFGETVRSINGSLECGGRNPAQVQSRIEAYRRFCEMLGVSPGANLTC